MPRVKLTLAENELLQMRFYVKIEISHIRISATGTCDERHAAGDLHLCGTSRGANVEPPVARSVGWRTTSKSAPFRATPYDQKDWKKTTLINQKFENM